MMLSDWDDLRFFLTISQAGTLSAAARILDVEHSTVARRLTRLEGAMGVKLFNRMARGWSLTTEGQALAARAEVLEREIRSLRTVALNGQAISGTVRITAPPAIMSALLVPNLGDLSARYPAIDIEAISGIEEANLSQGEADIAVRMSKPQGGELVARTVGEVRYALYGTARWRDVPETDRVFVGFQREARFWLARQMEKHVGNRRHAFRSNDVMALQAAASAGLGIALLPAFLGAGAPDLVPLPGLDEAIACPVYLVMQRDVRQAPRVRVVADHLAKLLRQQCLR